MKMDDTKMLSAINEWLCRYRATLADAELGKWDFKAVDCSAASKEITLMVKTIPSMRNSWDVVFGGAMAGMMDVAMSAVNHMMIQNELIPTSGLNITFLSPVKIGEDLIFCAKVVKAGRSLVHTEVKVFLKDGCKLVANGSGVFFRMHADKIMSEVYQSHL